MTGWSMAVYIPLNQQSDQDTVRAPADLWNWVADAVWIELLQGCHGNCIPHLHIVSCRNKANLLHGEGCRETT